MKKRTFLLTLSAIFALTLRAQAAGGDEYISGMRNDTVLTAVLAGTVIVLALIFLLMYAAFWYVLSEHLRKNAKEEMTFAQWLLDKLNASQPIAKEKEILLSHNYDGIQELDNDLPPWWKYMFYATIVWGCFYFWHYTSTGNNTIDEYKIAVAEGAALKAAYLEKTAKELNEDNVTLLTDAAAIENGKKIFLENCKTCHGEKAQGLSGPNLTDEFWINGCGIKSVYKVIKNGVQARGMLAWESKFSPVQIQEVASYVISLKGSNPEGEKEKQGDECKE
jgi:cytochrome c oxidase cbb3-type subunit 3